MNNQPLAALYLKELEEEVNASRKCLAEVPVNLFDWKPHEKSMPMGYLALIVAEIPKWITTVAKEDVIDFATFQHAQPKTTDELVAYFDDNMKGVRATLSDPKITDGELNKPFYLKSSGKTLMTATKMDTIASSIRHLAHHRGQLTVYLRLNNLPVPSIYGPSADDKTWG